MKNLILMVLSAIAVFFTYSFTNVDGKPVTESFWVNRDCEMCKAKIEAAADIKGVKTVSYDMDSYMLTVVYNPKKITIEQIHQSIANAGYDTSMIKASEEAYGNLPGCCQYDRSIQPRK